MRFLFSLLCTVSLHAAIVDRVAVSVGNKVITESDIRLRIRLTAFQNEVPPDFSLDSRLQATRRLIDQRLVEKEMDVGRYSRLASQSADDLLADYVTNHYHSHPAALHQALLPFGLTEDDLKGDLARQTDLLTFLNLRFRPAVQVSDQQVQRYFDDRIPAGAEKAEKGLNGMRAGIEQQLTNDLADKDLDAWLADQRHRTRITYAEKELDTALDSPAVKPR